MRASRYGRLVLWIVLGSLAAGCSGPWRNAAACEPTTHRFGDGLLLAIDAAGPEDVWAVGNADSSPFGPSLVLHWDGETWVNRNGPREYGFFDVTVPATNDVWAIANPSRLSEGDLLAHWNGAAWAQVSTPRSTHVSLVAVDSAATDDVWVAGIDWTPDPSPYLAHWDGAEWTRTEVEEAPRRLQLEDVAAYSSTAAWAVGNVVDANGNELRPAVLRWDGHIWRVAPPPRPSGPFDYLGLSNVVTTGTETIWSSTGYVSDEALIRWDGREWRRMPRPFYAIGALATREGTLWAAGATEAGERGVARLGTEGRWEYAELAETHDGNGDGDPAWGVVAVSETSAWAAGGAAVLERACLRQPPRTTSSRLALELPARTSITRRSPGATRPVRNLPSRP